MHTSLGIPNQRRPERRRDPVPAAQAPMRTTTIITTPKKIAHKHA